MMSGLPSCHQLNAIPTTHTAMSTDHPSQKNLGLILGLITFDSIFSILSLFLLQNAGQQAE
jgi:hypothetical protein